MAQIMQPQPKSSMSEFLPLAGALTAGILAVPTGGMSLAAIPTVAAGAGAGAGVGGLAKGLVDKATEPKNTAIDRRMQGVQQMPALPDQQAVIQQARLSLQSQPPEIQQQYGPMLTAASLKLRRDIGAV